MSSYLQSLTSNLHEKSLLTDELKAAFLEHDDVFYSKTSVKMTWDVHKVTTLREIHVLQSSYIDWLCKQSYVKDKFTELYEEAKQLLE